MHSLIVNDSVEPTLFIIAARICIALKRSHLCTRCDKATRDITFVVLDTSAALAGRQESEELLNVAMQPEPMHDYGGIRSRLMFPTFAKSKLCSSRNVTCRNVRMNNDFVLNGYLCHRADRIIEPGYIVQFERTSRMGNPFGK